MPNTIIFLWNSSGILKTLPFFLVSFSKSTFHSSSQTVYSCHLNCSLVSEFSLLSIMGLCKWFLLYQWSPLSSLFLLMKSYVSISIFHDSENPFLGLAPTKMNRHLHKKTGTRLFIAALFTMTTHWKKWPSVVEWIINVWYIYSNKNEQTTTTAICNNMDRSYRCKF